MEASVITAPSDLYYLLGVTSDADATDIRRSYKKAALRAHPDKGGSSSSFQSVSSAYQVLSCPIARQQYDQQRQTAPADTTAASRHPPQTQRGVKRRATSHSSTGPVKRRRRLEEGLECLRSVLQEMPASQRRNAALSTTPRCRQALIDFMQHSSRAGADVVKGDNRRPLRRMSHDNDGLTGRITSTRRNGVLMYKARVYVNSLCLYTRQQSRLETAIEHQIVLLEIRRSLLAAASALKADGVSEFYFWEDAQQMQQACEVALKASGVSESELGLRACVMMRAVRWIGPSYRIVTTSSSLGAALNMHVSLSTARAKSWEAFRAEWLRHLAQCQTYGSTGDGKRPRVCRRLSAEEAKEFVDTARQKALEIQLSKSIRHVEQLLKLDEKDKTAKIRGQSCQARGGG